MGLKCQEEAFLKFVDGDRRENGVVNERIALIGVATKKIAMSRIIFREVLWLA